MNKIGIIGYTGFVGSNILEALPFNKKYNSKNFKELTKDSFDLLINCGISAEKYMANKNPKEDFNRIEELWNTLKKVKIKKFVHISTVDIYPNPFNLNENDTPSLKAMSEGYGKNRLILENKVREVFPSALIIRLPGLYGKNLKKNFLFDLKNPSPTRINENIYKSLKIRDQISSFYEKSEGFWDKKKTLTEKQKKELNSLFELSDFSSHSFTNLNSTFQMYNLANLAKDIQELLKREISLVNLTCEPLSFKEIYQHLLKKDPPIVSNIVQQEVHYNLKSKYAPKGEYFYLKKEVLNSLSSFWESFS